MRSLTGKIFVKILKGKNYNNDIFEFHISSETRKKYEFDETLFSFNGNVIFANYFGVRTFTQKLNEKREVEEKVRPGQVNAMGLIDEIYHLIMRQYEVQVNPDVFSRAINFLNINLSNEKLRSALLTFVQNFPPRAVYKNEISAEEYLTGSTEGRSHYEITLEELMLLHFANFNPANKKFKEIFDDKYLNENTSYKEIITSLENFFRNEKPYGPENQHIFDLLKTPILNNPDSLEEQLKFIMSKWSIIIDPKFLDRILSGMDLIKEDIRFDTWGGGGGAPTIVPKYKGAMTDADFLSLGKSGFKYGADSYKDYAEPEKFTPDIHWMPRVVLLAKNIFVWLDQLSKKYQREIKRLDQIPDEELDVISSWNFTGLWLIGLWERSSASQKIKQINGNLDAVSSAYSLYDYVIANELGSEEAFQNLDYRCKQRGIRLASDMVPNHMGIFSKWVIERPDYFIQNNYPPFPNYTFDGADLSEDPDIEIKIEDGYWRKSDAAVVFKRVDKRNGDTRFIYHGNDGTNMPWNDTAQLNMLKEEVREAVIQTIFHVARKTSIIRFDAAMTLAKKHFQRLWFPQPGTGGDIPSRADHAMTRERFDEVFPKEFWREVVDRINAEMPETLLLAEAFWLMEGYFVRTLGMHRVYNSAFMHMMMKEENAKYRDVITNTLEFNPEILKRYVNFMSNPDEETAIKQFGVDDKYFGVATLMVTLPGLPMFGHGQVEGYTEKYGMEYKRAYYNETPNQWLVDRHKREIFPLMQKRYMFSQVDDFWFYDFHDTNGHLNENVFVYSNRYQDERALVVYNNKFDKTSGWIKYSTGKLNPNDNKIGNISLADALSIKNENDHYYIFRDHITNLQYIRTGKEFHDEGIFVELEAFKYHVFLDFKEIYDVSGDYYELHQRLNGSGVYDIEKEFVSLKFDPVHDSLLNLFETKIFDAFKHIYILEAKDESVEKNRKFILNRYAKFLNEVSNAINSKNNFSEIEKDFEKGLNALKNLNHLLHDENLKFSKNIVVDDFRKSLVLSEDVNYSQNSMVYLLWLSLQNSGKLITDEDYDDHSIEIFERLRLDIPAKEVFRRLGRSEHFINEQILLVKILMKYYLFDIGEKLFEQKVESTEKSKIEINEKKSAEIEISSLKKDERILLERLLVDEDVKKFIGVNFYEGVWYYSKENLDDLISWLFTLKVINYLSKKEEIDSKDTGAVEFINNAYDASRRIKIVSERSGYQLKQLYWNISNL